MNHIVNGQALLSPRSIWICFTKGKNWSDRYPQGAYGKPSNTLYLIWLVVQPLNPNGKPGR